MKKRLLSATIIVAFLFGTMSFAKEAEPVHIEEMLVIDAEEIGIREYAIGDDFTDEEYVPDLPEDDEEVIEDDVIESDKEFIDEPEESEEDEDYEEENEEVTESPAPPEGKVEGYVAGVYFDPNCFDCEICEKCYKCEDDGHIYAHCVSVDEERGYIYEEWCTVCGHGTSKVISDEEFEALGVETCVEF